MVAVIVADGGHLGGVGFLSKKKSYVDGVGFDFLDGLGGEEDNKQEEEGEEMFHLMIND